jgi:uncharacterized membrane protein
VGSYTDANFISHGFLLSGGQYRTIDDPNAINGTFANGINASGQVVGYYNAIGVHGFLLSGGQYTTFPDDPNGVNSTMPNGINARGQIVGSYGDANGFFHGFLATPVPGNSAAGDPSPDPAAATPSVVLVTVPVAQLTPTPLPAVNVPADPGVQVGEGLGRLFNGATTAVPITLSMTSGPVGLGHQDNNLLANDLLMSNLDKADSSWL